MGLVIAVCMCVCVCRLISQVTAVSVSAGVELGKCVQSDRPFDGDWPPHSPARFVQQQQHGSSKVATRERRWRPSVTDHHTVSLSTQAVTTH